MSVVQLWLETAEVRVENELQEIQKVLRMDEAGEDDDEISPDQKADFSVQRQYICWLNFDTEWVETECTRLESGRFRELKTRRTHRRLWTLERPFETSQETLVDTSEDRPTSSTRPPSPRCA